MLNKQLNIPVSNVNLPNKLEFINSYNDSKIKRAISLYFYLKISKFYFTVQYLNSTMLFKY